MLLVAWVYYKDSKRDKEKGRTMNVKSFHKGNAYRATNLRTHETFTVTCTHNGMRYATFVDASGNTFKGYKHDNATNYDMNATDYRKHVNVINQAA